MTGRDDQRQDRPAGIRRDGIPAADGAGPHGLPRARVGLAVLFALLCLVFSAIPLAADLRDRPNKDYSLWYQVGEAVRKGIEIYPDPASGRLFPFMYPPSAAALLGYLSPLGKHGTTLVLVLGHSVAWLGAVLLSIHLAVGGRRDRAGNGRLGSIWGQHPLLYLAPSLCIIALIHNTYLLGQPNLALLTLLLGSFACLRRGRNGLAGVLVATAAAIKAFPILALGYLIYRRMWRATAATILALATWLLIVPLPFRTPAQAVRDVDVWARGMVFTYNSHGIAQRPYRSFSYKNQSIMAMAHRLLRDVPADGEKAITRGVETATAAAEAAGKPLPAAQSRKAALGRDGTFDLTAMLNAPTDTPRWDDYGPEVAASLRSAWRVNVASLDFRAVTLITLAAMLGLSLFVLFAMPRQGARTGETDAIEFALMTLLIVMFSPLSFNYAFVWLLYPTTVAIHLALNDPSPAPWRNAERAWLAAVLLIPGLAVFAPLYAQAYGNLFIPAVLLTLGLGHRLRQIGARVPEVPSKMPHSIPARHEAPSRADAVQAGEAN
ncbi:glycosyltransferase family 87 protein [Aquisphaera insulae]|uniref:glycosyltransferase family 87 protein n=1 Tax=Aquisphaera insulae TaxID=2712864 RepID=UPI00202E41E2|nr:glycosyltransferase family 87 protein [Aquisphaera insulae]